MSWPVTCVSRAPSTESANIDLSLDLPGGIKVTIRGPASSAGLATQLLNHVAAFSPEGPEPSEFELVTEPPSPAPSAARLRGLETRDQIRQSFLPCPASLFVSDATNRSVMVAVMATLEELSLEELVTMEQDVRMANALRWRWRTRGCCAHVSKRTGGFMAAVLVGFLPEEVLANGNNDPPLGLVGHP
eukprot:s103_g41.t1